MKTLKPAMRSEVEELAMRYADDCARTLLAYYQAEQDQLAKHQINTCWADHADALDRFVRTFPRLEWRDLAEPALLRALEEARP